MAVAIQAVTLVAVIGIGVGIKRLGWATTADFPLLSKIVLQITLPCALVTSFQTTSFSVSLLWLAAVGFAANVVMQVAGYLLGRREGRRGAAFGVLNVGSFNMGAFATPYIAGFMGPQAVVYASLFDIGNAFSGAGVGYSWAMSLSAEQVRTTVVSFVKRMFGLVVFDTYLVLVLLRLLEIRLPEVVLDFTSLVGGANTFLAMLMIGVGLQVRLDRSKYTAAARYLGLRYGLATCFAALVWFLAPFAAEIRVVLVMVLFAPIASMIPAMTQEARGDVQLSALMTSISIVIGIVAMPVLLSILG